MVKVKIKRSCPKCFGKGKVQECFCWVTCKECWGTGFVFNMEEQNAQMKWRD